MKIFSQHRSINLLLLAGLLLITLGNIVTYRETQQLLSTNQWVIHTHLVIETVDAAAISLREAREEVIYYILSNHKLPLQDFHKNITIIPSNLQLIRELTLDNPIQQNQLDKIEPLIKQKINFLQQILAVDSDKNQQAALELTIDPEQQALTKEIMLSFASMIQEEQHLLKIRNTTFAHDAQKSNLFFLIVTILSECLLLLSLILLHYHLKWRTQAENKTEESEKRLRLIVDNARDYAIIMLDPKGIITTWSIGAQLMKGYRADEIIGQHFSCFYPQESIDRQHPMYQLKIAKEQGSVEEEGWRVCKDGSTFWANVIITALRDQEGKLIGYSKITRDLSERKKTEQIKSEFISVVSHELRTPLTSIRGSLGLILGGTVGKFSVKAKQLLDIANANCERLILLINDILDVEKIEAGKIDFKLKVVDINQLVDEAIIANKMYGEKFGVTLSLEQAAHIINVNVDPDRLMQVLANLISNAVKFSERGKHITVFITRYNETVRVAVNDKGTGIPQEFQSRIFQRFEQADSSDTRGRAGTGLGLNISKSIIEKLGGTLNFNSNSEKGTTFYFDLPIWEAKPVEIENADQLITHKNKLLICEDDEDQAKYLALLLESSGFQSDIALCVAQAKQLLSEHNYSALLLDLILPDQDGISFIRELRDAKKTNSLPIIVISIFAESGRGLLNGEAFEVIDWLNKPVDFNKLLQTIMRIKQQISPKVPRILHVEDDVDTQRLVATLLGDSSEVVSVATIHETREVMEKQEFDLVIIDLILPDGNGKELLPMFANYKLPIIVFSAVDLDAEYSKYVTQVLVKSKTSKEQLVTTIINLLKVGKGVSHDV